MQARAYGPERLGGDWSKVSIILEIWEPENASELIDFWLKQDEDNEPLYSKMFKESLLRENKGQIDTLL